MLGHRLIEANVGNWIIVDYIPMPYNEFVVVSSVGQDSDF